MLHSTLGPSARSRTDQYTGTIDKSSKTGEPGKQFDSSPGRGKTFDFQLGAGKVIQGWDKGLEGLCVGAKAILTIPPAMGYGGQGAGGDIPGGATLNFDVEVVSHSNDAPPEPNLFQELDTNEDGKLTKEEVLEFFKKQGKDELPDGLWASEDKDGDGERRRLLVACHPCAPTDACRSLDAAPLTPLS